MMNKEITYSVVVPVYNSKDSLQELCNRIIEALSSFSFEIVLVDDGSRDGSWQKLQEIKAQYPDIIKAVRLQKNYGQHAALLCAFNYLRGQYAITIDDDLQYDPADIVKLIDKQKETGAEVVYAILTHKQQSLIRKFGNSYWKQSTMFNPDYEHEIKGSSFRLISKTIIDKIIDNHRNNFIFIDEVLLWYTSVFAFVDVKHHSRPHGTTGYSLVRLLRLYISIVTNYSLAPLRAMIIFGFIFSMITFFIGMVFIYKKLFHNVPIGYTSTIVAILFSTSIIMLCLGILGQYLFKMYLSQQNKPLYTVKQIL